MQVIIPKGIVMHDVYLETTVPWLAVFFCAFFLKKKKKKTYRVVYIVIRFGVVGLSL